MQVRRLLSQYILILIIFVHALSCFRCYGSFNGKDFKTLAQYAPFVLWNELNQLQRDVWISLSKVGTFFIVANG